MFTGVYEHNIDDKSRLVLPAKFRDGLSEGSKITIGFDGCLQILTAEAFNEQVCSLRSKPFTSEIVRRTQRVLIANSSDVDLDKAGRISLPSELVKIAGISKSVTIIGVDDRIEIWSTERYQKEAACDLEGFEANAEQLFYLGKEHN